MAGTTLTKPIAFNEASFNVVLLHQTLKVLGLPVAPDEVKQKRAGQKTEELIRALQAQLNVPIETTALVAGATASAIADVLDKRGLTAADRSFTITGVVRLQDRLPRRQQKLLAFEVDIRGVGAYRAVKKVSDLDTRGGFAFLGSSASDNLGEYRLTFYDWQYRRPERKQANIVVYAVDDRGDPLGRLALHLRGLRRGQLTARHGGIDLRVLIRDKGADHSRGGDLVLGGDGGDGLAG